MKRTRQYIGILAAAAAYYLVHEGAHLLCAVLLGVFKQIRFMGIGMQIDVYAERMADGQMALFCVAGAAATLFAGIVLAALVGRISSQKSKLFRAVMYYITIALLLLDPLYLSILCGFFGGGDMNGISLLCPEWIARSVFAVFQVANEHFILGIICFSAAAGFTTSANVYRERAKIKEQEEVDSNGKGAAHGRNASVFSEAGFAAWMLLCRKGKK